MTKLKDIPKNSEVIGSCSTERLNTNWRFNNSTNFAVISFLLKNVPMGWKMVVLTKSLLRICTFNCLTYEKVQHNHITITCAFYVLLLSICMVLNDWQKKLEELSCFFINKIDGLSANHFQGVPINEIPILEDLLALNILVYDRDIVDGKIIGELARRSVQQSEKTVRLLRYKICYLSNISATLQCFRCPNCNFFQQNNFFERHLTTCSERVKNVHPKNVCQVRKILFDKLDSSAIKYTNGQKLFQNLAKFDFELTCVPEETFKDTKTTTWKGKQVPISKSICSNLVEEPIFFHNSDPHHLISSFLGALESLAWQHKEQMELLFPDCETTLKNKLGSLFGELTQHHNRRKQRRRFDMNQDDSEN